jgi:hypothetical protein
MVRIMGKDKFGWCVVIDGSNEEYISAYCLHKEDAEKLIDPKNAHWQKAVYWVDAIEGYKDLDEALRP